MPEAAWRLCPRCRKRVPPGRCNFCEQKRQQVHNATRDKSDKAWYDSPAWEYIRTIQLAKFPWCEVCNKLAKHVDHIIPRKKGGSDEPDNLQSLCLPCHSRKTAKEDGGFGN
jgi:5-methylcytosine-specific restriction enzyme A